MEHLCKIRTQCLFNLFRRDCGRSILIVVGENQLAVVDADGVDEGVNDLPLVPDVIHMAVLEAVDPADDLFLGVLLVFEDDAQRCDAERRTLSCGAKTALVERIGNAPAKEILCPSREMNSGCAAVLDRLEDFWFSSWGSKQRTLPAASIHFGFCTSF